MKELIFSGNSWADYTSLTGNLSGRWSRRIDGKNRIVYKTDDVAIELYELRTHYLEK